MEAIRFSTRAIFDSFIEVDSDPASACIDTCFFHPSKYQYNKVVIKEMETALLDYPEVIEGVSMASSIRDVQSWARFASRISHLAFDVICHDQIQVLLGLS